MSRFQCISEDVELGTNVRLGEFINLYGCKVGDNTRIGPFVEVQRGAVIGKNCKLSSHSFVCAGVSIEDNCFIGHGVMFINDKHPRATNSAGELEAENDWADRFVPTRVGRDVSIGSNATVMGGIEIGDGAVIGAGSVVTKNVPVGEVWAGNPAKQLRKEP